ncbi:hypothetical protein ACHAXR_004582 [Thalassiosira sp. AJA248-18]
MKPMKPMKPKSKSLAAILALASTTANLSLARAEINEGGGGGGGIIATAVEEDEEVANDADLLVLAVAPSSHYISNDRTSSSSSQPQRRRTNKTNTNGRRRLRRNNHASSANRHNYDGSNSQPSRRKPAPLTTKATMPHRHLQQSSTTTSSSAAAPGCGPTPGTHHSPYLGCYNDRINSRAFPYELHENKKSRSKRFGHGALDCERECTSRGYRYFGREFKGQCFCGNGRLEDIVRHGMVESGGCDCCGGHVGGGGKMCVWENANHPESQARPPEIPVVLPSSQHQSQQSSSSSSSHYQIQTSNSNNSSSNNVNNNNNQITSSRPPHNNYNQIISTHKPIGAFRLRLHWQRGYNWQNNPHEQYYCMECRNSSRSLCTSGSSIQINKCYDNSIKQKFIAISKTIRPASNPGLCLTIGGSGTTTGNPVKLRNCHHRGNNNASSQNFLEVRSNDKFELQPENGLGRQCLSQQHHPKKYEVVFPEKCEKSRRHDTTYWRVY